MRSVAVALTSLWGRNARSPRLATPALRTAEVLLSRTQLLSSANGHSDLLGNDAVNYLKFVAAVKHLCIALPEHALDVCKSGRLHQQYAAVQAQKLCFDRHSCGAS